MTPFASSNPEATIENLIDLHGIVAVTKALKANCARRSLRLVRTDQKTAQLWERRELLISGIIPSMETANSPDQLLRSDPPTTKEVTNETLRTRHRPWQNARD
jgi:hypothetical protein